LSYVLILAVLLVKLARVYRIFYHHSKMCKFCSDKALAMYVILLLSPSVIVLIVLTILAPYKRSTLIISHQNYVELLYVCKGNLGPY